MTYIDLSKTEYTSLANSFKNDGRIYTGTLTFPTSLGSRATTTISSVITLDAPPQLSQLYAYFQDTFDTTQQYFVGSGYNTAQWYQASVYNTVGLVVTAPAPQAGPLDAYIYPVINGNTVTVTGLVNNPYAATITITALSVPFTFVVYTLDN